MFKHNVDMKNDDYRLGKANGNLIGDIQNSIGILLNAGVLRVGGSEAWKGVVVNIL